MWQQTAPAIERASPADVMELVCDVTGTSMQVAALLVMEPGRPLTLDTVRKAIAHRIVGVPRMRQRLAPAPFGCGRPVWVDDAEFDIDRHVTAAHCPSSGNAGEALLEAAAQLITRRLPMDRPLWAATVISRRPDTCDGLLVVFHHVLADGLGGLAMLEHLVDGAAPPSPPGFPRRPPAVRHLWQDCWRARLRGLRAMPAGLHRVRAAARELGSGTSTHAPRCSLNATPVGVRREVAVARVDLATARRAAHTAGGTVNDVLLTAVTGALGRVLRTRGEQVDRLVISVPVSSRKRAGPTDLGNRVGVIPVELPTSGDPLLRLGSVARITAERKTSAPGSSAALIGPLFRLLARVGVFRWFIDHQRLINTFVTNLRGPDRPLRFLKAEVQQVIALPMITGNVSVAFAGFSYAGTLTVTAIADPGCCNDLPAITEALQQELLALSDLAANGDNAGQTHAAPAAR